MVKGLIKDTFWEFLAKIILISFLVLQFIRWEMLLQSMDVYYHLLTGWGFIQAGGYSGWDFWQYAPVGRTHIYPPLLHLAFAALFKLGFNQIFLARLFEVLLPWIFLCVLWIFIRKHYGARLGFFVVLAFFSSFSFYTSLLNHIPATLAFILGILSLDQLFKNKLLRSAILLGLCFYTHIGIPWFFTLAIILYGLFNKQTRREILFVVILSLILALPMLIKEARGLRFITTLGPSFHEKYLSQIKLVDLLLAVLGLVLVFQGEARYKLFLGLFIASSIFLIYPYRFFSAEGYFPVILLCALFFEKLYQKINKRYVVIIIAVFTLVISPTLSLHKDIKDKDVNIKFNIVDSGFINLVLAKGKVLWFPEEYASAAKIVRASSESGDIVFCSLNFIGLTISGLAGRASANALLPEIKLPQSYNPLRYAKIIIFTKTDDPGMVNKIVDGLKLIEVGENNFFMIYKNPSCNAKIKIVRASLPFWLIFGLLLLVSLAYWQADRIEKYIKNI